MIPLALALMFVAIVMTMHLFDLEGGAR